jgi:hypothetical protein
MTPAGKLNNSTGRVAAVCMRALSRGEPVRAAISHVPAMSSIQLPVPEQVSRSTLSAVLTAQAEGRYARVGIFGYKFGLDSVARRRNSSTDSKEQQRFLAWQKAAVGRR